MRRRAPVVGSLTSRLHFEESLLSMILKVMLMMIREDDEKEHYDGSAWGIMTALSLFSLVWFIASFPHVDGMTGIHVKHLLWWNAVWTLVSKSGYYIVMTQKNNELSLASLAAALDCFHGAYDSHEIRTWHDMIQEAIHSLY